MDLLRPFRRKKPVPVKVAGRTIAFVPSTELRAAVDRSHRLTREVAQSRNYSVRKHVRAREAQAAAKALLAVEMARHEAALAAEEN